MELPAALQLHILSFLPPNERALSGRLASPHIADALSGPEHCTAFLSQPLPPHAVPWVLEAGQQHVRRLPFRRKLLLLLCTAAASGSEANLEVALALLRPSVFPDVLQRGSQAWGQLRVSRDPGVAAIEAGHPQLLGWLLRHCPGLLRPDLVLEAAARHCDVEGLQAAWWGLRDGHPNRTRSCITSRPTLNQRVLDAAAGSATKDAMAKVMWALGAGSDVGLRASTAAAAACSGDLRRLRLLQRWGCPMGAYWVLVPALEHADLAVAQWLVDEAGCELPAADAGDDCNWYPLFEACVKAPDGAAKLQWLGERGAPPLHADHPQLGTIMQALAKGGHVEVLRCLLQQPGLRTERGLAHLHNAAAQSGCIPMVELLQQQEGGAFTPEAYCYAAHSGSVAMVRWLADEGGVAPAQLGPLQVGALLANWPWDTHTHSRDLLEAVQLLVDAAGRRVWHTEGAVTAATRRGELALVQYLLQQRPGYRPGGPLFLFAAEAGCEALLEWMVVQRGADGRARRDSPYTWPAMCGDLSTLTALRRLGVPWGVEDVLVRAVRKHSGVDALRWLEEQGAPVGPKDGMYEAVALEVDFRNMEPKTAVWLRGLAEAGQGAGDGDRPRPRAEEAPVGTQSLG